MEDLSIYVATHKHVVAPADPYYSLIQAGSAVNADLGVLRDDTGDNISARNSLYSELTAIYWLWKNARSRHIGLMHYRRFFCAATQSVEYLGKQIASGADILNQLKTSNCILVQPLQFYHHNTIIARSVEQQYVGTHHGFDLLHCRATTAALAPEYLPAFDFVMRNNQMIPFNMMITTREVFADYCTWMFKIFFALEERLPMASNVGYQARVMAFLAERLSTVWLAHNRDRLRLSFRPYVFYEDI